MDQTKVEQSTMEQILELLAKMNANQARMMASQGQIISMLKTDREDMKAWRTETKACREVMHACLEEEKEQVPEETEAMEKYWEVPEGAADEEKFRATEDRAGELCLAMRRHRQRTGPGKWWSPAEVCCLPRTVYPPRCPGTAQGTCP
jgi:hypothetical protein